MLPTRPQGADIFAVSTHQLLMSYNWYFCLSADEEGASPTREIQGGASRLPVQCEGSHFATRTLQSSRTEQKHSGDRWVLRNEGSFIVIGKVD